MNHDYPETLSLVPSTHPVDGRALVASAASVPEYVTSMVDVGSIPVHVPSTRLQAALANEQYPLARSVEIRSNVRWDTAAQFVQEATDGIKFEAESGGQQAMLATTPGAMLVVEREERYGNIRWTVSVAADTRETANKWIDAMATILPYPPPPPPEPPLPHDIVPVRFWMEDRFGDATSRRRYIQVQDWADIETNYAESVRGELANLIAMDSPSGGKLALLHGPPGTGKTRLLLSLMSEWRDWCQASVVTDTDRFFGNPSYLNSLLFSAEGMSWMALILEDADEFIAVSAKENKGQAISRLLNCADGIVGQGLNLLFIMTTNVDVKELNPAMIRPGRCMANVNVGAFPATEANAWFEAKGSDAQLDLGVNEATLAEMYARLAAAADV